MCVEDGESKFIPHLSTHVCCLLFLTGIFLDVFTRFLVHRYSVMREHVEANKIEGVDDVDSHSTETEKAHYNEDSDQVSPPLFLFKRFDHHRTNLWFLSPNRTF